MKITSIATLSGADLTLGILCPEHPLSAVELNRLSHPMPLAAQGNIGVPALDCMGGFRHRPQWVAAAFIAALPNGSSDRVRIVGKVSGEVFEQQITVDLPAAAQFVSPQMSPRLFCITGAACAFGSAENLLLNRFLGNRCLCPRLSFGMYCGIVGITQAARWNI